MNKKCPNCNTEIRIIDLLFLNKKKDTIQCSKCNKLLITNSSEILAVSTLISMSGVILIVLFKEIWHNIYLVSLFLILYSIFRFIYNIEIIGVSEKTEKELLQNKAEEDFRVNVNFYKKKYKNFTKCDLEKIAKEKGWQKEAKQASKELLKIYNE